MTWRSLLFSSNRFVMLVYSQILTNLCQIDYIYSKHILNFDDNLTDFCTEPTKSHSAVGVQDFTSSNTISSETLEKKIHAFLCVSKFPDMFIECLKKRKDFLTCVQVMPSIDDGIDCYASQQRSLPNCSRFDLFSFLI